MGFGLNPKGSRVKPWTLNPIHPLPLNMTPPTLLTMNSPDTKLLFKKGAFVIKRMEGGFFICGRGYCPHGAYGRPHIKVSIPFRPEKCRTSVKSQAWGLELPRPGVWHTFRGTSCCRVLCSQS